MDIELLSTGEIQPCENIASLYSFSYSAAAMPSAVQLHFIILILIFVHDKGKL